jgi:hypothetical protein
VARLVAAASLLYIVIRTEGVEAVGVLGEVGVVIHGAEVLGVAGVWLGGRLGRRQWAS